MYQLKALDSFFYSSTDTKLHIWLIWLSHDNKKKHQQIRANQEFIKNLRKQFVGAIKNLSSTPKKQ